MKLAIFTNQFPGRTCSFFARDVRGLLEAGIDIDVFPIYPVDSKLWRYVPEILNEKILPRSKVHNLSAIDCLKSAASPNVKRVMRFARDAISIGASAATYGFEPLAKSSYVLPLAWAWANEFAHRFDHVLAYWGNYAATCAYVFHRLCHSDKPFSLFLHANIDLFRKPIFMRSKLVYADRIITCSEFNRSLIGERFGTVEASRKLYVHHHGLDFLRLEAHPKKTPSRKVIAVGRLTKQKGFDYLIRAAAILKHRGENFEIELIGDGPELAFLHSLARDLDVQRNINFRGWLPPDDVPFAIREAVVLVHPSPDLGDGVPNVIKEAMAVGTSVIGSHVAGIPELLDGGKCGFLVPPKNPVALADAIHTLLSNEASRERYAKAARKRAEEKYDLWRNGRALAEVLGGTVRQPSLTN